MECVPGARRVLIDIDGVRTVSWKPLPGAVEALAQLRDLGLPLALLTNTTSRTRASIARTLADAGFPVVADDILTAPAATAAYLAEHFPDARCLLLNSGDIAEDLEGVTLAGDGEDPDVVVVGGAAPECGYRALNEVFGHLQRGARLMATHRNLYSSASSACSRIGGFSSSSHISRIAVSFRALSVPARTARPSGTPCPPVTTCSPGRPATRSSRPG
nr:HAD family hydrolase [Actinacidiphila oryziradicis]